MKVYLKGGQIIKVCNHTVDIIQKALMSGLDDDTYIQVSKPKFWNPKLTYIYCTVRVHDISAVK